MKLKLKMSRKILVAIKKRLILVIIHPSENTMMTQTNCSIEVKDVFIFGRRQ